MDGEQLIMTIARNKETNKPEARKAFDLFCGCYLERVTQMAVVLCRRWRKSEDYAYVIVQCAFDKVWQYPTFVKSKTRFKDTDKAILHWIATILYHELSLFSQKGDCSHPEAEDLPIITSPEMFIEGYIADEYLTDDQFEWWAAFSKYYQIPDGETWNAIFNLNINPSASNTYKNFALILAYL